MVTGASGFVGQQVVRSLAERGADVVAVSRRRPGTDLKCTWLQADLLNEGSAAAVVAAAPSDVVVHLAWVVEHSAFWTSPLNLAWVAASLRLAHAAADAGVKRFVGAGTCYEYAWPDDADCQEDVTAIVPGTVYGASKDATRRVLSAYLPGRGLSFAWARLFFLYGPGEGPDRLVPSICRSLATGEPALCSRGLAVRDFMDVRDAGSAIAAVALAQVTGDINIATGERASVADVAGRLGRIAGRPDLVCLGARPDRVGEPVRITADGARLRRATGFHPTFDLDAGLADAMQYWRHMTLKGAGA